MGKIPLSRRAVLAGLAASPVLAIPTSAAAAPPADDLAGLRTAVTDYHACRERQAALRAACGGNFAHEPARSLSTELYWDMTHAQQRVLVAALKLVDANPGEDS